jgi:hypothetical protein
MMVVEFDITIPVKRFLEWILHQQNILPMHAESICALYICYSGITTINFELKYFLF